MNKITLLLFMREEKYGKRLLRYILDKRNPCLHPELITFPDMISMRTQKENETIVVLTDYEKMEEFQGIVVIFLTQRGMHNQKTIYQFQKTETIYSDLLRHLGIEEVMENQEEEKRGVLFVLSHSSNASTTMTSLLTQYLGRCSSCLFISLVPFPIWHHPSVSEEINFRVAGVDELLFMTERSDFEQQEKRIHKPMGKASLLPPLHHIKDLFDSTKQDWQRLFQRLQEECGYDNIVVELGLFSEHTWDLLSLANEIIFLREKGKNGENAVQIWKQYCQVEKKEELLLRTNWLLLPEEWQEWEEMIIQQPLDEVAKNNQLMEKVRKAFWQKEEESVNVCNIEDFG